MSRSLSIAACALLLAGVPAAAGQAAPAGPQAPVQARPGGPETDSPSSDQTVDVTRGWQLVLSSQAGEATVRTWDRDAVRVQATHSGRERIDVQTADNTVRVRARTASGTRGPAGMIDYVLTVPRWMPVSLSGTYLAANIEGAGAEVNVETVGGDITLKGGTGAVTLRSIEGEIRVENATGKVQATTVNDSISMTGVSGDVVAETTNGDVVIANSKTTSLEISTVNGDVRFEGPTADKGVYRVTTHNGDVRVSVGAQANATVFVRTFGGDFSSDFPVTLPEGMSNRDGNKRFNFTLGSGSARVELQSFQGDIHVSRAPLPPERQRRRGAAEHGHHDLAAVAAELAAEAAVVEVDVDVDVDIERELERALEFESPLVAAPADAVTVQAVATRAATTATSVSRRRTVRRD
jgi:DUF4097 and DUF4098 domain-containing protein YvlB